MSLEKALSVNPRHRKALQFQAELTQRLQLTENVTDVYKHPYPGHAGKIGLVQKRVILGNNWRWEFYRLTA